ncbi:MAG: branched-chain amino acid transaminase [Anaerolineales bacterium]|nr:branched-chain amino acid transaminase [Anaerolineales bacterium]QYK49912.1 MAG: branched-chain amino acid transaminase [Anaerolineales bacterium]
MAVPNYAYFQGKIVPYSEAKIGVMTHALNYGTAIFGGVRGYWNDAEEELFIFRPHDHLKRLYNSAKLMVMDIPVGQDELMERMVELLQMEGHRQDVYLRPMAYFADEIIGVKLHDLQTEVTLFSVPFSKYVANDTGAHVTFSSWRRLDDNMIPARGKIAGAYVNTAFIKTDAVRAGFDEAIVLTADGHISEGSAENIFMVRDGVVYTPPITDNILEGITRRSIIELARHEGYTVIERSIDRTEVFLADEMFMTGTAAQVTAITKVDHRKVGDGVMGPVASRLRQLYDDAVRGRLPEFRHWNYPVYEKLVVKS